MKILVVGDYIEDRYVFGTATRLCPEAPVPVLSVESEDIREGGAGLAWSQLNEWVGKDASNWFGSTSIKERFYSATHLLCRVDRDSIDDPVTPWRPQFVADADAVVVCDYSKGALTEQLARTIVDTGKPCFVDAKNHWHWYEGPNVTIFPNSREAQRAPEFIDPASVKRESHFQRIVHKLAENGCRLQDASHDITLPAAVKDVVDICGAGDIFMAAFVYAWSIQLPVEDSLQFANALAGESCRHLGTYVVPREFAQSVLDRLRASRESAQPTHGSSHNSSSGAFQRGGELDQKLLDSFDKQEIIDSLAPSCERVAAEMTAYLCNRAAEQILRQSPSDPTLSTSTPTPEDQGIVDVSDDKLR